MSGAIDVRFESESSGTKYDGKIRIKCVRWGYTLTHLFKLYDLGMLQVIADALGFDKPFPSLAIDFGKHTENFTFDFIINDGSPERNEETLTEYIKFIRFKAALAQFCFLYIGENIKADGSRIFDLVEQPLYGGGAGSDLVSQGKGIQGKIGNLDSLSVTKEGFIKGRITFIQCVDLLNW